MVSFAYNIGAIDQLKANGTRTRTEIADKILAYNKAGGKVLAGLTKRRQEERTLFLTPVTAKVGWQQEDGHWRYYYPDDSGRYVTDAWWRDRDKYYCFDAAGYMLAVAWIDYMGCRQMVLL